MNQKPDHKRVAKTRNTGFLTRLARDERGNTLAIIGAALLPMLGMIGSGVDLARYAMAQARLQQACDAAALAGRRAMSNGIVDDTVKAEAQKFFKFNFYTGNTGTGEKAAFNADPFTPTVTPGANTTVVVSAETKLPMGIMYLFGFNTLTLSTTCDAKQDFVNTDIMLVLDTTGSMKCDTSGNNCNSGSSSKIVALRSAVLALYDELKPIQDQLAAQGLRLRYGVVPYSSSVNMGKVLRGVNASYVVADTWDYQSRRVKVSNAGAISSSTCTGSTYNGSYNSSTQKCTYFEYGKYTLDVSQFVQGNAVEVSALIGTADSAGDTPVTAVAKNSTWNGCIEERQTVNTITSSSGYTIPSGANDLNVDLVPTATKTTKWAPYWVDVEFTPTKANIYSGNPYKPQYACPTEAERLQTWTRADLSTYLNSLIADGGTYHDNGIIWGTRMLSSNGVFQSDNPTSYGSMPVTKHIIFMTDGLLDTGYNTLYTTYGVEKWDMRVTPGGGSSNESDQGTRHRQRFKMMCNAAKGMNISIWVVAFASALDSDLTECASNASQASTSANSSQLNDKFVEIGKNIGSLRLTK